MIASRRLPIFSLVIVIRWTSLAIFFLAPRVVAAATPTPPNVPLVFETHVRPILKAHCFHCHGEAGEMQGGLDVRMVRLLTKGGESGPAVVANDRAKSPLFERIAAKEMPPGDKKLSDAEIATIGRWIDAGAKTLKPESVAVSEISDEDRAFWSFQPIRRPAVPKVRDAAKIATPIDAFLLAELEKHELGFSPEADRATLVRRLYFDLIGLPPTPQEVEVFVADKSPQAYEKLVDRLLASPHYGERWGRHWLDVAGYADSDGYSPVDPVRPNAYKYRDYVIRSFNDDKPWNEFIVEQLAGDELVRSPVETPKGADLDKLIATGFLRMGPDGTGDAEVDQPVARNDVLVETIKIVSTSLLGLSVGCAQCHSHRYDPIPQTDYYRFRALFEPAYDPANWRAPRVRQVSTLTLEERKLKSKLEAEQTKLTSERGVAIRKLIDEAFEATLKQVPEKYHTTIRKSRNEMAQRRSMEEAELFKKYPGLNGGPQAAEAYDKQRYDAILAKYDPQIAEQKKIPRPVEDFVLALTETPGKVPTTKLFFRGDHNQPRDAVEPGELSILDPTGPTPLTKPDPTLTTTGRRLAYARHLTDGKHPLVARVLVNRFWLHHFGRGLVATPGDFGALGEKPSHPELLDWLADEFMAGDWRLKRLHKTLLMSTAYRQSSRRTDKLEAVDPDNRLLGRMSVRRLEAEILRDSVLATSGKLNLKMFGPAVPVTPDPSGQVVLGIDSRDGAGRFLKPIGSVGDEAYRRSIYVQARRSLPLGMLETFDAPEMTPNCECRATSTVTPQSLLLMNSEFVIEQSQAFAERLLKEAKSDRAAQVRAAWRSAFGVAPTNEQVAAAVAFIEQQVAAFTPAKTTAPAIAAPAPAAKATAASTTAAKAPPPAPPPPSPQVRALASFCQSLLSSNGFLYID